MPFHIGQIVCLKSDPSKRGMVSSVFGRQVEVFIDGNKKNLLSLSVNHIRKR